MSGIRVTFRCGHPPMTVKRDVQEPPRCPVCKERVVARVVNGAPTFRAAAGLGVRGPLVKQT